ncbi:MAG: outer membrane lipoprotein carrier protein LolA [Candidatus Firestonebacteria bacterium]|nr:outer membrane lipoprotein carrier protein LolA [Candidatus Firestonebacteria bacterium]
MSINKKGRRQKVEGRRGKQKRTTGVIYTIIIILFCMDFVYAFTSLEVIKNVKDKFRNAKTIHTDFKQVIYNTSLKNKQIIYGIVKIKKPDKLLMTYEKPENLRQKIIINNSIFWLYLESANQLIKRKDADSEKEVEKQIFPWMEEIDNYNIIVLNNKNKYIELEITPKNTKYEKFNKLIVHVNPENWAVIYTYMLDISNNTVEFYFRDIKFNQNLENKEFDFIPPKDVEILENE